MTDTTQTNPLEHQPLVVVKPEEISKAYELPDAKIAEIRDFCNKVNIAGVEDKANYKTATQALSKVKKFRTGIEAKRKELKEPFLEAGKAIDAEAKRLTALLAPIEESLSSKIKVIDTENARIEAERRAWVDEQMRVAGYTKAHGVFTAGKLILSAEMVYAAKEDELERHIKAGLASRAAMEAEQAELKRLREMAAMQNEQKTNPFDIPTLQPKAPGAYLQNVPVDVNASPASDSTKFHHPHEQQIIDTPETVANRSTFAPGGMSVDYRSGYVAGGTSMKLRILEILNSSEKLTRAQWIDKIERLIP